MKTPEEKRKFRREQYLKNWDKERTRGRQYYQEKKDWILAKNRKYINIFLNSPSNIVQNTFQNRQGENFGVSVQSLNDDFLSGKVIDFDGIDFSNIEGCHQELSLPIVDLIQN